ncbi:MAG: hypothetical protein Q9186_003607 [Xanthomendoza sp. 1 TL-2023]
MKVTSIVYAGFLAVVSVQAAAAPQTTEVATPSSEEVCNQPGYPCHKMKRAAEAVAEAIAEAEPEAEARRYRGQFCYRRGEACAKAKRDALALAEAVAEAHASANPEPVAAPEAEAGKCSPHRPLKHMRIYKLTVPNVEARRYRGQFCYRRGEACAKVKRAAAAIAEAIAEPEPRKYRGQFCYRRGEACAKNKRALEDLNAVVEKIQNDYPETPEE